VAVWLIWLITARLIIPGFFDYKVDITEATKSEELYNKIIWLVFACGSVWIFSLRMDMAVRVLRASGAPFLALLLYTACSVLWSMDAVASLSRFFHLVVIVLACLGVTIFGWHERRFQEVVRPVITFFLLGSLIFGLVAPDLAIQEPVYPHTEYYWGGLTIGKNALGAIASTGVIFWVHGWASREVKPFAAACGAALSFTLIMLARAATYMLSTILVCVLLLLVLRSARGMRRYMPYIIVGFVVLTALYGLAVLRVVPGLDVLLTPITALSGRDTTFTNRALIWQIAFEHIGLNPMLGTGYGAFWANVQPGTPAYEFFVPRMFFNPGECHDGYIEIINDLGYVGLLLLFGYLWSYLSRAIRLLKTNYTQATLYLAVLFQQLLSGLTESNWLWIDAEMLIFTLATICLARHQLDMRSSQRVRASIVPDSRAVSLPARSRR
jgi:O-antigen ligase